MGSINSYTASFGEDPRQKQQHGLRNTTLQVVVEPCFDFIIGIDPWTSTRLYEESDSEGFPSEALSLPIGSCVYYVIL